MFKTLFKKIQAQYKRVKPSTSGRFDYKVLLIITLSGVFLYSKCNVDDEISKNAMNHTDNIVSFGPRYPGSKGIENVRKYLRDEVSKFNLSMKEHTFVAKTPKGDVHMKNLYYDIKGSDQKQTVLLTAHYDSKNIEGIEFVGANDAASSVALLLALTPYIQSKAYAFNTRVLFLDGEEAFEHWSSLDSLYGSRAYVQNADHLSGLKAAIVVDMIADKNLSLIRSAGSHVKLLQYTQEVLDQLSMGHVLEKNLSFVEDDHVPFIAQGVDTLHLMDFSYGSEETPGKFWHTKDDVVKNISAQSMALVGQVILGVLDLITKEVKK